MNEILLATASCWPTGLPHCTRSTDHSRAIFSACFATPVAIAGRDSRPALSVVSAIFRPSPSLPIKLSLGTLTR
ncbi:Uncharacterised protein [Mycobacterium tuberculosis]|nr:Uncharacterised protein [Mycobacterium tuberculosis]COY43142.1 Uncharacterised protein [Mycobacterium tuberculosis]